MIFRALKKFDYILIITTIIMCLFGLVMVYSASYPLALENYGDERYFFSRQLKSFAIGITLFVVLAFIPHQVYKNLSPLFVVASLMLLVMVLIPSVGVERNYSQRWVRIGSFMFQPSEVVKLGMILYFAAIYAKKQRYITDFRKGVLPPLLILAFVCMLILLQPDLGTATSLLLACGVIIVCSGVRFIHLLFLGGIAVLGVGYFAFSETYRLKRLLSFRNPFADASGDGYQLINSYFAIANGGISGTGIGNSVQKFGYLPEAHTDFIMAVIIEELGLIGLCVVLILYFVIMYRGLRIGLKTEDPFSRLLAIGLTFQMMIQAFFNLGAVSGLLPITGITLPFVSYGGSSLIMLMISMGILVNISTSHTRNSPRSSAKSSRYQIGAVKNSD